MAFPKAGICVWIAYAALDVCQKSHPKDKLLSIPLNRQKIRYPLCSFCCLQQYFLHPSKADFERLSSFFCTSSFHWAALLVQSDGKGKDPLGIEEASRSQEISLSIEAIAEVAEAARPVFQFTLMVVNKSLFSPKTDTSKENCFESSRRLWATKKV